MSQQAEEICARSAALRCVMCTHLKFRVQIAVCSFSCSSWKIGFRMRAEDSYHINRSLEVRVVLAFLRLKAVKKAVNGQGKAM